tara:strand:- start:1242 stop:1439 length:198 start_codon:yes stop_codon:yes gene_type:complete
MSNVRKIADVLENSIEYMVDYTDAHHHLSDQYVSERLVEVFIKKLNAYEDQVRKEIFNDQNGGAK